MATTLIIQCSCGVSGCKTEIVIRGFCRRIVEKTDGIGERVIFTDGGFDFKKFLSEMNKQKKKSASVLEKSKPNPPNMLPLKMS